MTMRAKEHGAFMQRSIADAVGRRAAVIALGLWLAAHCSVLLLSDGVLPFDRPALPPTPFVIQLLTPTFGMIEVLALIGLVYWLTRRRVIPDLAARAPERSVAARETFGLLIYAALGQAGGWVLGPALGYRPFSFHIAGTLYGCTVLPPPGEIWTWAIYNFVIFAVVPLLWFRRRYDATQLNLRSTNRRNDLLVILAVCLIESAFEFGVFGGGVFRLDARQLLLGPPLSFFIFLIGTVLPTMVLIYAILIPRYLKLTNSPTATVLLGGLTYALMHIVEGWTAYDTPRDAALSVIFVILGYLGPGMIKTFLTLRTGNAWVHALGYHLIAPHLIVDTPLIVKAFGIA